MVEHDRLRFPRIDTLVVETAGLNDRAWLDGVGHPRSESMRITERYRRRDYGHMDLEITFDDPKYYTRPFTLKTAIATTHHRDKEYLPAIPTTNPAHPPAVYTLA